MLRPASNPLSARRYRVELITAESESSLFVRHRRLIRFPQLTMPLLAAWTPPNWEVSHTDEIVQRVDLDKLVDLVGITANTPAAPHAYVLAQEFRRRGVAAVIGGPHATLLPDEVAQHADATLGPHRGPCLWQRRDHRLARLPVCLRLLHYPANVSAPNALSARRRS